MTIHRGDVTQPAYQSRLISTRMVPSSSDNPIIITDDFSGRAVLDEIKHILFITRTVIWCSIMVKLGQTFCEKSYQWNFF